MARYGDLKARTSRLKLETKGTADARVDMTEERFRYGFEPHGSLDVQVEIIPTALFVSREFDG